ncbi:hypothetical protein VTL71DRAFT_4260 [Oculimacula yallundae]|uniref:Tr-type G domain-containing protein n=1 Tax=Oculimacula yallundae TaxID=86028 RepID=A0ABR4C5D1_9HELO
MASIFTYETEPSRVSSPWLTPTDTPKPATPQPTSHTPRSLASASSARLEDHAVTRLEAEPQDGPTEYKLHLLLRPRRNYSRSSTGSVKAGSYRKRQISNDSGASTAPSGQSRQNRFEQLTTQLLWRLQQSSPYHDFSTSELVLPKLPDATNDLEAPLKPAKLLAGLEQSRGALYEIGVSDDGTFVGLTEDEMNESLNNLKAMAASLGCNVEVVRMVVVGECEWQEPSSIPLSTDLLLNDKSNSGRPPKLDARVQISHHEAQLWVAEALVSPNLGPRERKLHAEQDDSTEPIRQTPSLAQVSDIAKPSSDPDTTEQLRVTLTGPTTSGKSSLLGTLSTATLDNGRGKSRLSLLKHRHEIASGVTSSVAQELIGYRGQSVINYASGNVTSWTDIHFSSKNGRLVFVSDSAGHWRYRRTIVRGLIGWAPHWTVLCIGADDGGNDSSQEATAAGYGVDLDKAHLELCLKLDRPLAVVVTKLDLASKASLRQTLSKILSIIKATGRIPSIIPPDQAINLEEPDLNTTLPSSDGDPVRQLVKKMTQADDLTSIIPILMTSSAKATGVRSLHSLLQHLPIPPTPTAQDLLGPALNPEQPACLFHIEEVFGFPASLELLASKKEKVQDSGVVVAGYLRFGSFSVGDTIVIGPFPADLDDFDSPSKSGTRASPKLESSSFRSSATELSRLAFHNATPASVTKGEWFNAHIVSIRNLRLPVHTLRAGQVGTVGVVFDIPAEEVSNGPFERPPPTTPRMRKGQVIAIPSQHMLDTDHSLQAAGGFTASFEDSDINSVTPGSLVVIYVASIRAAATVLKVVPHINTDSGIDAPSGEDESDDVFGLDSLKMEEQEAETFVFGMDGIIDVTFELLKSREWIELGSQVLVMPGGGHGLYYGSERGEKGVAGLDGFAGRVVEVWL